MYVATGGKSTDPTLAIFSSAGNRYITLLHTVTLLMMFLLFRPVLSRDRFSWVDVPYKIHDSFLKQFSGKICKISSSKYYSFLYKATVSD
jgi:hypothetical protein